MHFVNVVQYLMFVLSRFNETGFKVKTITDSMSRCLASPVMLVSVMNKCLQLARLEWKIMNYSILKVIVIMTTVIVSEFCILKESKRKDISGDDEVLETLERPRKRRKLQMKVRVVASPSTGTYVCRITHGNCQHLFLLL